MIATLLDWWQGTGAGSLLLAGVAALAAAVVVWFRW